MKRSKILVGILAPLVLLGCSSVKPTFLADGQKGYVVSCHGPLKSWSTCMQTAGKVCRSRGYTIHSGDEFAREMVVSCAASHDAGTAEMSAR